MNNLCLLRCLLFVGLLLVTACAPQVDREGAQTTGVTVFEGARLIVGDGSEPIEDAAFIIENDRFTAVGRRGELQVPAGAARVDLTGKTVMPTIIDLHTHFRGTREDFIDGLEREAYFGVGAVSSIGSPGDLSSELRNNPMPGAALYRDGGRGIRGPGNRGVPVTTEAEARKAVQEHAAQKVDMIKIYVDPGNSDKEPTLTPPLYEAIIDEANKLGYRVVAHLRYLRDGKRLLRAGLHGFLHVVRDVEIDDEFVSLIKQRPDVFVAPNLPPRGVMPDLSFVKDIYPPAAFEDLIKEVTDSDSALAFAKERPRERFAIQAASLRRLKAEGVPIGFGTDSSVGFGVHIEMEDMVVAGLTPADVIVAATKTSAELLRLTDHGTVAAGKSASFIVLDANPLEQITNTRRISEVYLRGTKVDRAGLKARWTADKAWRRHENS